MSAAPWAGGFIYKTFCAHCQEGEGVKTVRRRGPLRSTGKVPSDLCQCLPLLPILLHTETTVMMEHPCENGHTHLN